MKKREPNNKEIELNILYIPHSTNQIRHAYKSKFSLTKKHQVILLLITDSEKWHYFSVKSLFASFRGTTGNNNEDLNYFKSYTTKNKLKKHKKVCESHNYCYAEMPEVDNKILKYSHGEKSVKSSIYYLC